MSYSPALGRWIQQDPAGYVDGLNQYLAVSANPINFLDPSGLADLKFDGQFNQADIDKILASLKRINARLKTIITEIDGEISRECHQSVKDKLSGLRNIVIGMETDLRPNPAGGTFWFVPKPFNPDAPLQWRPSPGTQIELNTKAKKPWNTLKDDVLDYQLFHELTHEQGTDDGESGDDFNNAHRICELMFTPVSKWGVLSFMRFTVGCKSAATQPTTQP